MSILQKIRNTAENLVSGHFSIEDPVWVANRAEIPDPRSIGSFWAMKARESESPDHVPFQPENYPPGYEENELLEKKTLSKVWVSSAYEACQVYSKLAGKLDG